MHTRKQVQIKKPRQVKPKVYRNHPVHFADLKLYDSKFSRHFHRQGIEPFASFIKVVPTNYSWKKETTIAGIILEIRI